MDTLDLHVPLQLCGLEAPSLIYGYAKMSPQRLHHKATQSLSPQEELEGGKKEAGAGN